MECRRHAPVGHLGLDEPPSGEHLVGEGEDVARRVALDGDEGGVRLDDDPQVRQPAVPVQSDRPGERHGTGAGLPGERDIPALADRGGDGPRGRQGATRLRRLQRRVEHRVARPVGGGEVLRAAQGRRAVQEERDALGGVGVLVQVDTDARHTGDREGPGRDRRAVDRGEIGQDPPADARVDVTASAGLGRDRGDLGHRVDDALRVGGSRPHEQHGVLGDGRAHRLGLGPVGPRVDVDEHRLDPEGVSGLEEGRVGGRRQDHPRVRHLGPCVTGGEDGEEDRLGASGGHRADGLGPVEEPGGPPREVVLHRQQRGEGGGVEAVGGRIHREGLPTELVDIGETGVVDVGEGPAAVRRQVVLAQHLEARANAGEGLGIGPCGHGHSFSALLVRGGALLRRGRRRLRPGRGGSGRG